MELDEVYVRLSPQWRGIDRLLVSLLTTNSGQFCPVTQLNVKSTFLQDPTSSAVKNNL